MSEDREHGEALLAEAVRAYEAADFDRCLTVSTEAEGLFIAIGDLRRAIAARQRQAMAWAVKGDLGSAIAINRQLVTHYRQLGDTVSAAKCNTNLAYNLRLLNRHPEALSAYVAAWKVFVRQPDRVFELAVTHMNLGQTYRDLGDYAFAYAHARRGERLFSTLEGSQSRVVDCMNLAATALDRLDRFDDAEVIRQRAEALAERTGDRQRLASVRRGRGTTLARRGRLREALHANRGALSQFLTASHRNAHSIRSLLHAIAGLYVRTEQLDSAWPYALLATRLVSLTLHGLQQPHARREWRERHAAVFDLACDLLVRRDAMPELAAMIEYARAQQSVADDRPLTHFLPGSAGPSDDAIALDPLCRFMIGEVGFDFDSAIDTVLDDITDSPQDRRDGRTTLAEVVRADHRTDAVDIREIGRRVGGQRAAVWGTLKLGSTLYWYVIDGDGTVGGAIPAADESAFATALRDVSALVPDLENYADRIRRGRSVMSSGPGARLALALLPSAVRRQWVDARDFGAPRRVVLVPAAEIARLPIAALPLGANAEPLLTWLRPVYIPTLALAASLASRPMPMVGTPRSVALVVADPTGDLPGARRLASIAESSLTGSDATRRAVIEALAKVRDKGRRNAVFVYAGHTTAPDDSTRAVLQLADSDISASDWLSPIGRADFAMPSTVVLLSCSSGGLGAWDWYGLTTAALAAGATTVVATLWPHPDSRASMDQRIVQAVATTGDPVANVYTLLERLSTKRWGIGGSPFVWANYIVVSIEPDPAGVPETPAV